jgi:hypothetical protein
VEGGGQQEMLATGGKSKAREGERRVIKCTEVEIYSIN